MSNSVNKHLLDHFPKTLPNKWASARKGRKTEKNKKKMQIHNCHGRVGRVGHICHPENDTRKLQALPPLPLPSPYPRSATALSNVSPLFLPSVKDQLRYSKNRNVYVVSTLNQDMSTTTVKLSETYPSRLHYELII